MERGIGENGYSLTTDIDEKTGGFLRKIGEIGDDFHAHQHKRMNSLAGDGWGHTNAGTDGLVWQDRRMRPKVRAGGKNWGKFDVMEILGTLPVLMAIPCCLLTSRLATTVRSTELVLGWLQSVMVLVGMASVFFVALLQLVRLEVVQVGLFDGGASGSDDNIKTAVVVGGLALANLAGRFLPTSRLAVLYLGLYIDVFNPYTAIVFVLDLYQARSSQQHWLVVICGYAMVLVSFVILNRLFRRSKISRTVGLLSWKTCSVVASLSFLVALFISTSTMKLAMIGVNFCSSVVLLMSLQHSTLIVSHINPMLIAVLSLLLEYIVTPGDISKTQAVVKILLAAIIQGDKARELEDTDELHWSGTDQPTKDTSVLTELLSHSDTKVIFNFLLLNSTFMFIQLLYSFRSHSLGLLSDSLHMALDCTSLALGLVAGVLLKKPANPNSKFPFGLKNFETLAGFTNGTLLVGISGSIVFEAVGRLLHPVDLERTTELIIVSFLGLLVNLVGIFAFNHGHAHGHSHGHTHGHSHSHSHTDSHTNSHTHSQTHSHTHSQEPELGLGSPSETSTTSSNTNTNDLNQMNDNMKGIFLHVLADTLGSVGVVFSTILTKFFHSNCFDPIASIIIAVLIFLSAIPLIKSTALSLLLKLESDRELKIRAVLHDIVQIKGIKSYSTPRFWPSSDSSEIFGYLHVQIYRDESTSFIKAQCEQIFIKQGVDVMLQVEKDYENCWCRSTSAIIPS